MAPQEDDSVAPPSRVDKWVAAYKPALTEEERLLQFLRVLSTPVIDLGWWNLINSGMWINFEDR